MALTISRDKNMILIQSDSKKVPYKFDVNTGIFYGLTGKPVKGTPAGLPSYLENKVASRDNEIPNALTLMYYVRLFAGHWLGHYTRPTMDEYATLASYFRLADKLESIGYTYKGSFQTKEQLDEIMNKNDFKAFAKWYKDHPDENLNDYLAVGAKNNWLKKHNIVVGENHVTEELVNELWNRHNSYEDNDIEYVIYYMTHGLYDYYDGEETSVYYSQNRLYQAFDKISEYLKLCNELGQKPEKGDFFRNYINARRTYLINRQTIDNTKLAEIYDKHPELAFETDELFVKIPRTREDFLKEANSQHNCVYSYYLPDILKGKTLVVFIRQKSNPDHSYITCEVTNRGHINQYLGFGNSRMRDERDIAFENLYQRHLDYTWTK